MVPVVDVALLAGVCPPLCAPDRAPNPPKPPKPPRAAALANAARRAPAADPEPEPLEPQRCWAHAPLTTPTARSRAAASAVVSGGSRRLPRRLASRAGRSSSSVGGVDSRSVVADPSAWGEGATSGARSVMSQCLHGAQPGGAV